MTQRSRVAEIDEGHAHGRHEGARRGAGDGAAFTKREAHQARRLSTVLALVASFFVLELGGAIVAESVVLQADALHLLMDVMALSVSLLAMRLAVVRPTQRFTYGLRRAEPVAAIFSAMLVLATTGGIVAEAVEALHQRKPPRAGVMIVVALMALAVNGLSAWLLHDVIGHSPSHGDDADNPDDHAPAPAAPAATSGRKHAHGHTLNLRGAWLHLLGDTLGALAALVAALFIRFGGSPVADPIASFLVAAILLVGSLRLVRDATMVLLEAAPAHLSVGAVHEVILAFPDVAGIHDMHVWTLGAGHDAITVHVRTASRDPSFGRRLSDHVREVLHVEYVTVQVEAGGER